MKIELHAHTSEVSPCANVPAAEMVADYARAGYGAVVVTDHFNNYVLESYPGKGTKRAVERYLEGNYELVLKAVRGKERGEK